MQEQHCQFAENKEPCLAFSTIYGVVIIVCGIVIYVGIDEMILL